MGWRSWNLYGANVNQTLMQRVMDGMVRRDRLVDGVPTSLCDLGYCDVGLDDNWQQCGSYGAEGYTYHDEQGNPIVNTHRFPSFKNMTSYAHALGLTSGWYGNNCICQDKKTAASKFYAGDVKALREYGFDSIKLDGCGAQVDLQLWDDLIKATAPTTGRKAIMVENCHWGSVVPFEPTATWCPWNFFRTSGDIRAAYASVVGNLQTTIKYATSGLSRPGCWAYPDMLEVGCKHGPGGESDKGLTPTETKAHFAAWAIISSPLTLSHDVNDPNITDQIWDVITNKEAIAVNQAWAGHSGSPFKQSDEIIILDEINYAALPRHSKVEKHYSLSPTAVAAYQFLYKPLERASEVSGSPRTAVLMMNHAILEMTMTLKFSEIPGVTCTTCQIRDIWAKKDLGTFNGNYTVTVAPHDAPFLIISDPTSRKLA